MPENSPANATGNQNDPWRSGHAGHDCLPRLPLYFRLLLCFAIITLYQGRQKSTLQHFAKQKQIQIKRIIFITGNDSCIIYTCILHVSCSTRCRKNYITLYSCTLFFYIIRSNIYCWFMIIFLLTWRYLVETSLMFTCTDTQITINFFFCFWLASVSEIFNKYLYLCCQRYGFVV